MVRELVTNKQERKCRGLVWSILFWVKKKQGQHGNDLATIISETVHQYKQNIQHNQWNSVTPP